MIKELPALLEDLCDDLSVLWALDAFKPYQLWSEARRSSKTVIGKGAAKLPITQRAVRGLPGVQIELPERLPNTQEQTRSLIVASYDRPEKYHSPELQDALTGVRNTVEEIGRAIDLDTALCYRLSEVPGYKTWSPAEFADRQASEGWSPAPAIHYLFPLSEILAKEIVILGFSPTARAKFDKWDIAAKRTLAEIDAVKSRKDYKYEARVFLNGPPIDLAEDAVIAHLALEKRPIEVFLGYATDEILSPLVEYKTHPAIQRINTIIRYEIDVPVEAGEDPYLEEYARASLVAQFVLDSLRLCRPREDIGILALKMIPRSILTPDIREPWANRYHSELASFEPRRFDFSPASTSPLTIEEVEVVRKIVLMRLSSNKPAWRFQHAINRFGNSIEKYSPEDPERLLEYAIALEALYLNDIGNDRGELTYRLSLRAARLLESDVEKRKRIFFLVKNLYSFRSKIAHGADISRIKKESDRKKLEEVLKSGPDIVARSILKLIHNIDENQESDATEFWRAIELA